MSSTPTGHIYLSAKQNTFMKGLIEQKEYKPIFEDLSFWILSFFYKTKCYDILRETIAQINLYRCEECKINPSKLKLSHDDDSNLPVFLCYDCFTKGYNNQKFNDIIVKQIIFIYENIWVYRRINADNKDNKDNKENKDSKE